MAEKKLTPNEIKSEVSNKKAYDQFSNACDLFFSAYDNFSRVINDKAVKSAYDNFSKSAYDNFSSVAYDNFSKTFVRFSSAYDNFSKQYAQFSSAYDNFSKQYKPFSGNLDQISKLDSTKITK